MSKAVLISIRPKWCQPIASGKKTIEVRKTRPTIETPFKGYIYETIDTHFSSDILGNVYYHGASGRGRVIGEFVCDKIDRYCKRGTDARNLTYRRVDVKQQMHEIDYRDMCLSPIEFAKYGDGGVLYGWHIFDLVIYDQPRELREFRHCGANYNFNPPITRPPQSWCYVEEEK